MSFFIEISDDQGNKSRLDATSTMLCHCAHCASDFMVFKNSGRIMCPHCMGRSEATWGRLQIAFIPENESDFPAPPRREDSGVGEIRRLLLPDFPDEGGG